MGASIPEVLEPIEPGIMFIAKHSAKDGPLTPDYRDHKAHARHVGFPEQSISGSGVHQGDEVPQSLIYLRNQRADRVAHPAERPAAHGANIPQ